MDRETASKRAEWVEQLYTEVYGDLIEERIFAVYTNPQQLEEYINQKKGDYSQNKIEPFVESLRMIKEEPSRARNFDFKGGGISLVYLPNDDPVQLFEEVFHSMSRLDNFIEETYVPIASYTAIIYAENKEIIDNYAPKTNVEQAIGMGELTEKGYNFPTSEVDNEYKGRKTTAKVLEFFARGNNGNPLSLERISEISKTIYEAVLMSNDSPETVMKRALHDLEDD